MMSRRGVGILFLLLGVTVFAIRLRHAGPYALPEQGNLRAALLSVALGVWFSQPWLANTSSALLRRMVEIAVGVGSLFVLFFTAYAILSEVEEVVVVSVQGPSGESNPLRLWVMDSDGAEWVNMSREKAISNNLVDQRVDFLRGGVWTCRQATLVEERAVVARNSDLGAQKYAVKRFAIALGIFSEVPPENIVSVRLDPCPGVGSK